MIHSFVRTVLVLIVSVAMFPVYLLLRLVTWSRGTRISLAENYSRLWFRIVVAIAGIKVRVIGSLPPRGALLAPNHIGYADILALGSTVPCTFVTRTEILRWPVVGFILKSLEQPAVERVQSRDLKSAADSMGAGLREGKTLAVFLEGTSTGGDRVLPFRTPVVQAAIDAGAPVVPVAIVWSTTDQCMDLADKVAYWKKAHDFGPHVWDFFSVSGRLAVTLTFTEAIPADFGDRKKIAALARDRIMAITKLPAGETLPRDPESFA
ncbi:1-acyl-sn-glycerol-3-phosphate acyltransferase [Candidatus Sumerlaeota bacterium]|nr:1-acyl-sn-glycerol-3-phosphate acyltransferase [Candidatus Sumerlaeota bacterium]